MKAFLRALVVPVSVVVCWVAWPRGLSAQGPISITQTFCIGATNPCVSTYHNDNNRDGVNPNETTFTPGYVQTHSFTAMSYPTDGLIYAQPLYIKSLNGSNQKVGTCPSPANIIFAATENNSVYAVEATPPPNLKPCWQLNLNQSGETAIPYTSLPNACANLLPQVGITGTPVIDVSVTPPILYVVSSHQNTSTGAFAERLHAIDTTTGLEVVPAVDIPGALGTNFIVNAQNQRAGLALNNPSGSPNLANIYIAWASNCDSDSAGAYNGWLAEFQMNYSTPSISFKGSFTSEPTGNPTQFNNGGIWMAGSAPAIDSLGHIYVAVANGVVTPPSQTTGTWGNSVLRLRSGTGPTNGPAVLDFYTPNDYYQLDHGSGPTGICFAPACPPGVTHTLGGDTDMGTGGVVLLSSSELVSVGKQGMVYAIPYNPSNNTTMGGLDGCGYNCSTPSDPTAKACSTSGAGSIAQCFEAMAFSSTNPSLNGIWSAPAFWPAGGSSPYLFGIGLHDRMYWYNYVAPTFTRPLRHRAITCSTSRTQRVSAWAERSPLLGMAMTLPAVSRGRLTRMDLADRTLTTTRRFKARRRQFYTPTPQPPLTLPVEQEVTYASFGTATN